VMGGATLVNPLINLALIPITQRHFGNGAIGAAVSLLLTELLESGTATDRMRPVVGTIGSVGRAAMRGPRSDGAVARGHSCKE